MGELSGLSRATLYVLLAVTGAYAVLLWVAQLTILRGATFRNPDGSVDDWRRAGASPWRSWRGRRCTSMPCSPADAPAAGGPPDTPEVVMPRSVKLAIGLIALIGVLAFVTQGVSAVDFDLAVRWGLQEDDPGSPDRFVRGHAVLERGTAVADILVQCPLALGAVLLLSRRRAAGLACAMGLAAVSVYWPLVDLFQESLLVRAGLSAGLVPAHVVIQTVWVSLAVAVATVLLRHRRLFDR